nr:uncharacterized protein CI109_002013 [Kwoniella shandongensis]KAA5529588.1 hypothetical protein CI109_002013 [Kwoniella shandongensis]
MTSPSSKSSGQARAANSDARTHDSGPHALSQDDKDPSLAGESQDTGEGRVSSGLRDAWKSLNRIARRSIRVPRSSSARSSSYQQGSDVATEQQQQAATAPSLHDWTPDGNFSVDPSSARESNRATIVQGFSQPAQAGSPRSDVHMSGARRGEASVPVDRLSGKDTEEMKKEIDQEHPREDDATTIWNSGGQPTNVAGYLEHGAPPSEVEELQSKLTRLECAYTALQAEFAAISGLACNLQSELQRKDRLVKWHEGNALYQNARVAALDSAVRSWSLSFAGLVVRRSDQRGHSGS